VAIPYFVAHANEEFLWSPLYKDAFVIDQDPEKKPAQPDWIAGTSVALWDQSLAVPWKWTDSAVAIGRGRLKEHYVAFLFQNIVMENKRLVRLAAVQVRGVLLDLYDFNQETYTPAKEAATVQLGYRASGDRHCGAIYVSEIYYDDTFEIPGEGLPDRFPDIEY
jgi:hypothetical protein